MAIIGISGYAGVGKDTVGSIIQYLLSKLDKPSIEEVIKNYKENEWWLEEQSGWQIKKFAYKVKYIASLLTGIDIEKFEDQEFKKTNLGPEWDTYAIVRKDSKRQIAIQDTPYDPKGHWLSGTCVQVHNKMTVREFLQKLGTDALRDGLHPNVWVNALFGDYVPEKLCSCETECRCMFKIPNWIITDTRFQNEAIAIKNKGGIIIRVERPGVKAVNAHPSETSLDFWKFDYKILNNSDISDLKEKVSDILKKEKLL